MKDRKGEAYAKVEESYDALMDEGIEPLFALLSTGDTAGYNAFLSATTNKLELSFSQALGFARAHQWHIINQAKEARSEEHTSELQSLMRISYAVFCLKTTHQKNNLD